MTILLSKVLPNFPSNDPLVDGLNLAIDQIALDLNTANSRVIVVDPHTNFVPATMHSADGIHPNEIGDAFVAGVWADTLLPFLGPTVCPAIPALPAAPVLPRWILAALLVATGAALVSRRLVTARG